MPLAEDEFVFFAATVVAERLFVASRWLDAAPLSVPRCGKHTTGASRCASTSSPTLYASLGEAPHKRLLGGSATTGSVIADDSSHSWTRLHDTSGLSERPLLYPSSSPRAGRFGLVAAPAVFPGSASMGDADPVNDEPAFGGAKSGVFGPDGRTLPGLEHPVWMVRGPMVLRESNVGGGRPADKSSRQHFGVAVVGGEAYPPSGSNAPFPHISLCARNDGCEVKG